MVLTLVKQSNQAMESIIFYIKVHSVLVQCSVMTIFTIEQICPHWSNNTKKIWLIKKPFKFCGTTSYLYMIHTLYFFYKYTLISHHSFALGVESIWTLSCTCCDGFMSLCRIWKFTEKSYLYVTVAVNFLVCYIGGKCDKKFLFQIE